MSDRRDLQEEINRINELYQEKDLEMRKAGATIEQRQQMRDMLNAKKEQLISEMGDDLQKLNAGKAVSVKKGFKKLAGILPLAGAGMAAMSGDPAMAADELAGDVPLVGQAYDAIKPEAAGDLEADKRIITEIKARQNYDKSPAANDREKKLRQLLGQPVEPEVLPEEDWAEEAKKDRLKPFSKLRNLF